MKIYTRKGDKGTTALFGGARVSKSDLRISTYGTVDELNSWLGVVLDHCKGESRTKSEIRTVQNKLFTLGSILAREPGKDRLQTESISTDDIDFLEKSIDEMERNLPALRNFVLPGGTSLNSFTHVARTVCRRAERLAVELAAGSEVDPQILAYLNRLSDWLFVLARYFSFVEGAEEILWKSSNDREGDR